jgi:tRNA-specific 2-thiouridylase
MRHGQTVPEMCEKTDAALPIVRPAARKQGCCSASDAGDARRIADRLGIAFYALNFEDEFARIVDYFVDEYASGRTPNPCVMCNNWLKFGKLFHYADGIGADFVATGHYARLRPPPEPGATPALCRGRDLAKDQSYVLFGVDRARLARMLFPVGDHQKSTIRAIARDLGLPVADKLDSQEICFVPDGDYAALVRGRRKEDHGGEIVTDDGQVVGRHAGIENFTVGQRKGLGVALGEPHYVLRLEAATRRVVIGPRDRLARREIFAERANWLVDPPSGPIRCQIKIRYKSPLARATVEPLPGGRLRAVTEMPQFGVAPGQALVCYDEDRVLGGGWIV